VDADAKRKDLLKDYLSPHQNAYLNEGHLSATMPMAGFPNKQV
jgi:hypothetical protein